MFAARYFANRYFPKRYWPNLGDVVIELARDTYRVTLYICRSVAAAASVSQAMRIVRFILRRLGVTLER